MDCVANLNIWTYVMDFIGLLLLIGLFYAVVFIVSDSYLLPKLDRYLDERKRKNHK